MIASISVYAHMEGSMIGLDINNRSVPESSAHCVNQTCYSFTCPIYNYPKVASVMIMSLNCDKFQDYPKTSAVALSIFGRDHDGLLIIDSNKICYDQRQCLKDICTIWHDPRVSSINIEPYTGHCRP